MTRGCGQGGKRSTGEGIEVSAAGTLFVVATPIGNLGDITLRALDTLRSVTSIAAEDTRHTRKLLAHYQIAKPLLSYHSHSPARRGAQLIERLRAGEDLALVSDAGTPGISDPGTVLVQQALEAGLRVVPIPGPAALIAALAISGLATHPFAFLGFAPSRGANRRRFFFAHAQLAMTLVLYEAPNRLLRTLRDIHEYWGNRQACVARELTKRYEECFRGTVADASAHFASREIKGEIALVIAGAGTPAASGAESDDWKGELSELLDDRISSLKDASRQIAEKYGISKKLVYQRAIELKRQ